MLALTVALLSWSAVRWRRHGRPRSRPQATTVALAVILAIAAVLRVVQVRGVVAPPWVDGYHHTLITTLVVAQGAVPTSLRPFVDTDQFYYHFGFHALAAAVAWLSGVAPTAAVLWTGQALNALTVLAAYLLAARLTGSRLAGVAAAAVPASLYWFPAYFVAWGRYTQLAGLVALPAAWALLAEALAAAPAARRVLLAGAVAAGLLLVHYRVFAFWLLGVVLLAGWALRSRRSARHELPRLAGAAALGVALAAPWLVARVGTGVSALSAASDRWFVGPQPEAVNALPSWLFTIHHNRLWLAVAAAGVFVGLLRRQRAAAAVVAYLGLAVLAVSPTWLGLPASWMLPRFALAISLFLPVAMGVSLLALAGQRLLARGLKVPRRSETVVLVMVVAVAMLGAWGLRAVINPETVILQPADLGAAEWVKAHTPPQARFLVSTGHWQLGTYRGLDGGYWLPLLAGRATTIPAALYVYGRPAAAREIAAIAAVAARGDALTDAELLKLMAHAGADHVYVGPAGASARGKLSIERLRRVKELEPVYELDGVAIFRRRAGERR
jgi:hypothetical protein